MQVEGIIPNDAESGDFDAPSRHVPAMRHEHAHRYRHYHPCHYQRYRNRSSLCYTLRHWVRWRQYNRNQVKSRRLRDAIPRCDRHVDDTSHVKFVGRIPPPSEHFVWFTRVRLEKPVERRCVLRGCVERQPRSNFTRVVRVQQFHVVDDGPHIHLQGVHDATARVGGYHLDYVSPRLVVRVVSENSRPLNVACINRPVDLRRSTVAKIPGEVDWPCL
mmetsp:Transcript_28304/g.74277  ORF Transcript_28304/g.74277 Transcript_28304/m.74277 type:complete len:217 (-) Transcript_28304:586-1236(-)